jgi:ELWxxDGT repeat protein
MELWRSDGTPAGTLLVKDIQPVNSGGSDPDTLQVVNGTLYFSAFGGSTGRELWRSDGTTAGTRMVIDLDPTIARGGVHVWPAVRGQSRVFFTGSDGIHGSELYASDGSAAGTQLVADVNPGADSSGASFPTALGSGLFVWASTPATGIEPWRVDLPAGWGAPFVADRHVFYNGSAFDGGDRAADARDDAAVASGKLALRAHQTPTYANWTNYGPGINGVMVDVANLGAAPTADDFVFRAGRGGDPAGWELAATPTISVRRGAGTSGTDRVTFTWPDGAAPRNAWLAVTVKANDHTGLAEPDVFYFGNLVGDTGLTPGRVDSADRMATRFAYRARAAGVDSVLDVNRDGRVDIRDEFLIRLNTGATLPAVDLSSVAEPAAAVGRLGVRRRGYLLSSD